MGAKHAGPVVLDGLGGLHVAAEIQPGDERDVVRHPALDLVEVVGPPCRGTILLLDSRLERDQLGLDRFTLPPERILLLADRLVGLRGGDDRDDLLIESLESALELSLLAAFAGFERPG